MRILVVEDDEAIRLALEDVLEFEDYYVHSEPDGQRALEWLRQNPRPSVIILDLMMPVMDGFDFRAAQLKDPELAHIPVIVITASKQRVDSNFGAHRVLLKPLTIDSLAAAVQSIPIATDPRTTDETKPFVHQKKEE